MADLQLRPFVHADIDTVNRWVTSDELAHQFAGPWITRPIEYDALIRDDAEDEVAFTVALDGEAIGTAQLRGIDHIEKSCRIACVLLYDPEKRGSGIGGELIDTLRDYAIEHFDSQSVTLFVLEGNEPAIRCYQRCGFAFTGGGSPLEGGGIEMQWTKPTRSVSADAR